MKQLKVLNTVGEVTKTLKKFHQLDNGIIDAFNSIRNVVEKIAFLDKKTEYFISELNGTVFRIGQLRSSSKPFNDIFEVIKINASKIYSLREAVVNWNKDSKIQIPTNQIDTACYYYTNVIECLGYWTYIKRKFSLSPLHYSPITHDLQNLIEENNLKNEDELLDLITEQQGGII